MSDAEVNRREFLSGLAGAGAGGWLALHPATLQAIADYVASARPQAPLEFLTAEQAREFDAISAQIVPTDETPGAREAQVVRFIDRWFATAPKEAQPGARTQVQAVFTYLAGKVAERTPGNRSFAALTDAQQIALLTELEKSSVGTFGFFRNLTMFGMFSDPVHGGNTGKAGWRLIGFEDRYSWQPPFGYYDS